MREISDELPEEVSKCVFVFYMKHKAVIEQSLLELEIWILALSIRESANMKLHNQSDVKKADKERKPVSNSYNKKPPQVTNFILFNYLELRG